MKIKLLILITSLCISILFLNFHKPQARNNIKPEANIEERINDLLNQMTLEEKISLLGGDETGFNGPGIERLNIPPIKMSDGPVGVRTGKSTAFPVSVNMAASWDTSLIYRYGIALGEETKAKGKTCILGPCVGIHRFPLNGRNFESFGEDPFLSSRMAVNAVKGIQSENVIATVKHYACNDQEWERNNYDVHVDERTLREIHLPAFEYAVKEGKALAIMSAYNIVNGQHCSENKHLLTDILKKDWDFKGIVMSDWVSVYSADIAANNGLDLEMPRPIWFKDSLMAAIKSGKVSEEVINDKVRRLLRVRIESGYLDNPMPKENQSIIESEAHRKIALEMAQKSIVLLKNDNILPLSKDKIKTIALIGPLAKKAATGGGGSSKVTPWEIISPYDGLSSLLGNKTEIKYNEGTLIDLVVPVSIPSKYLKTPDGKENGLLGEYFSNKDFEGSPVFTRIDPTINFEYNDGSPDPRIKPDNFSIRWTGKFVPEVTREYQFAVSSDDGSRLFINGKMVIDNWGQHSELSRWCDIKMESGKTYDIKIEYYESGGGATMRFGWADPFSKTALPSIEEAVKIAKSSDVAVLCVGNNNNYESEGADVEDFKMTGKQDELVQAVVKANPRTIVVVYGGVPVLMKNWLSKSKAVIAALYPGQEGGTALAQILFGDINPSGKLPFSYIQNRSQFPAFKDYQDKSLKVNYNEGIFVGYRYYDKNNIAPLFPFGYGLSYTKYKYSGIEIKKDSDLNYTVSFNVKNTGMIVGEETAQLYIGQKNPSIERPVKELKGFSKVSLKPGEEKTINIKLNPRSFQYYDTKTSRWTAEPGEYHVQVGTSSRDIRLNGLIKL